MSKAAEFEASGIAVPPAETLVLKFSVNQHALPTATVAYEYVSKTTGFPHVKGLELLDPPLPPDPPDSVAT
jgi:hypothetical protein